MRPEAPQTVSKRHPRGSKKRSQTARRKKDRTKTIPRPSWIPQEGGYPQFTLTPGAPFGRPNRHQHRPRNDQKSKRKFKMKKRRSKTILDPQRGAHPSLVAPLGHPLGAQKGTQTDPKTIKNRSENSRGKKTDPRRSGTRLGAILGCLGGDLGPTWTSKSCCGCSGARFFEKSLFRS